VTDHAKGKGRSGPGGQDHAYVRYRRYYSHENPDGSTTVTSYGPLTTGASIAWKSAFETAFIFFIAFCLLSPWSPVRPARSSGPAAGAPSASPCTSVIWCQ